MKQILTIVLSAFAVVCLITLALTLVQVNQESINLENDLKYRSSLLADGLRESVEPNFINQSNTYLQDLVERYSNRKRIAGLAVVDNAGNIVAVSSSLPKEMSQPEKIATNVMDADKANGAFATFNNQKMYVYAEPLHDKKSVVGALLVVQNASYIDSQLFDIWTGTVLRLFIQILLFTIAILFILRWIIYTPLQRLVESLRLVRLNKEDGGSSPIISRNPFFYPLFKEVIHIQQSLIQARLSASEEAKVSLEKLDSPWTAERLKQFVKDILKDRTIVVVSNREPYVHTKNGNKIEYYFPPSGMVTAIEPVMQATGGIWIAHGSGDADKLVVDENDKVQVPPDDPKYTLKRVWLTEEEEKGYYSGFSNEGIWPMCHIAHTRPVFKKEDWEKYKEVNEKFAKTVLAEIRHKKNPVIFIQDFHFALLSRMIKEKRPDATIGIFWHIPWPNPEEFSICPWRKQMLEGMLGADIIGFHTQLHCNNFIETVGRELESLIDFEQFTIAKNNHKSYIKAFPISIAFTKNSVSQVKLESEDENSKKILEKLGIKTKYLGIGVDRLDYTKGILERLKAVEIFLTKYPSYVENFTFLQLCAPSRTSIKAYQEFDKKVQDEVVRINNIFKKNGWEPIIFFKKNHSHDYIYTLYRAADLCLVTSLHDGMNLVAKEFVAARDDDKGVLILSQFTGASRELHDALIVNPYNGEETADAIFTALKMPNEEQTQRMLRMRDVVKRYNVYRWSAELLRAMVDLT